jgi:hypothetical protein
MINMNLIWRKIFATGPNSAASLAQDPRAFEEQGQSKSEEQHSYAGLRGPDRHIAALFRGLTFMSLPESIGPGTR